MQIYQMTLKQYQKSMIRHGAKIGGVTLKEAREYYPIQMVAGKHFEACFEAARMGIVLRRVVLDSLNPMARYRIFHDLPDYLNLYFQKTGNHYIEPEARKKTL